MVRLIKEFELGRKQTHWKVMWLRNNSVRCVNGLSAECHKDSDGTHIWTKHTSFLSRSYCYHFFLLSYKHFTQAGPVMQLVMFDVSYIDCTPFKTKGNYTADYQFKCNILLHQWIPRDYESVRNKRLKSPELDTVQELVIHNLQRSQKLPGYRRIELYLDHKNRCGSRDTNIGCHDISIIKIAQTLLRPLLLPNMYENTWAIIKYVLCFCTK